MAAVDYKGIRDTLTTTLQADSRISGARIYVEEEPQFGLQDQPAIALFMDNRRATPDQSIAAGKRTRYQLRFSLWTAFFSLGSFQAACDGRDNLIAQLELVLMDNRTIGGKVETLWLEGGELLSAKDSQSGAFVALGETGVVALVSAINT